MAWSKFRPPFISLRDAESAFCLISPPSLLAGFDRVCQCLSLGSHCVCVSIRLYLCVYVSVYPGVSVCPCIYLCVSRCPLCALPYFSTLLPCWVGSHALVSCILVGVSVSAPPFLYLCVSVCLFVRVTPALLAFYDLNQDTDTSTESTRLESCGLFRGVLALVCVLSVSVCLCLFWDS